MIVNFETSKLAKEKGFETTSWFGNNASLYDVDGEHIYYTNYGFFGSGLYEGYIKAPLQYELREWLLKEHQIEVFILPNYKKGKCNYDSWLKIGYVFEITKGKCNHINYYNFNTHLENEWFNQNNKLEDIENESFDEFLYRIDKIIYNSYNECLEIALYESLKIIK